MPLSISKKFFSLVRNSISFVHSLDSHRNNNNNNHHHTNFHFSLDPEDEDEEEYDDVDDESGKEDDDERHHPRGDKEKHVMQEVQSPKNGRNNLHTSTSIVRGTEDSVRNGIRHFLSMKNGGDQSKVKLSKRSSLKLSKLQNGANSLELNESLFSHFNLSTASFVIDYLNGKINVKKFKSVWSSKNPQELPTFQLQRLLPEITASYSGPNGGILNLSPLPQSFFSKQNYQSTLPYGNIVQYALQPEQELSQFTTGLFSLSQASSHFLPPHSRKTSSSTSSSSSYSSTAKTLKDYHGDDDEDADDCLGVDDKEEKVSEEDKRYTNLSFIDNDVATFLPKTTKSPSNLHKQVHAKHQQLHFSHFSSSFNPDQVDPVNHASSDPIAPVENDTLWNSKKDFAYGLSTSLYEWNPQANQFAGEPVADVFAVCARKNNAILAIADGVNWGASSRLAARCAVRAAMDYLNLFLFPPLAQSNECLNTEILFQHLLNTFYFAHKNILKENGGLSTLTVAIICPILQSSAEHHPREEKCPSPLSHASDITASNAHFKRNGYTKRLQNAASSAFHRKTQSFSIHRHAHDSTDSGVVRRLPPPHTTQEVIPRDTQHLTPPSSQCCVQGVSMGIEYVVCVCSVGDSNAYVYSPRHGIQEITEGNRNVHVMRNLRDTGGALGPYFEDNGPELHNLTLSLMTGLRSDDVVFLTTDGISDNCDPVINHLVARPLSSPSLPASCPNEYSSSEVASKRAKRLKKRVSLDAQNSVAFSLPVISAKQRHELTLLMMQSILTQQSETEISSVGLHNEVSEEKSVFPKNNEDGAKLLEHFSLSAWECCARLLNHSAKITAKKRKILENPILYHRSSQVCQKVSMIQENYGKVAKIEDLLNIKDQTSLVFFQEQKERRKKAKVKLSQAPGKLDHASITAFHIKKTIDSWKFF